MFFFSWLHWVGFKSTTLNHFLGMQCSYQLSYTSIHMYIHIEYIYTCTQWVYECQSMCVFMYRRGTFWWGWWRYLSSNSSLLLSTRFQTSSRDGKKGDTSIFIEHIQCSVHEVSGGARQAILRSLDSAVSSIFSSHQQGIGTACLSCTCICTTHCPQFQGWASGVLLLSMCCVYIGYIVRWFLFFF